MIESHLIEGAQKISDDVSGDSSPAPRRLGRLGKPLVNLAPYVCRVL